MNLITFTESTNPFDEIKQVDEDGNEYDYKEVRSIY